jgi:hypothetical protein
VAKIVSGEPRVVVQITNRGEVAVEAWQLRLAYIDLNGVGSSVDVTMDTYAVFEEPNASVSGPIPPGAVRNTNVWLGSIPQSVSTGLRLVVYSNVSVAGDQEAATQVFARRERDAQALDLC